jgi:hypothetical protein
LDLLLFASLDLWLGWPQQFKADVVITAHQADATLLYPPAVQRMLVQYDSVQGFVKATISEGVESGRQYIRHYTEVSVSVNILFVYFVCFPYEFIATLHDQ